MGQLKITDSFKGDLGELIFEHFAHQNSYAYLKLEEIYNTLSPKNKLCFRYNRQRIPVQLPDDVIPEITQISTPLNKNKREPYFVFDYMTLCLRSYCIDQPVEKYYKIKEPVHKNSLTWVEIKYNKGILSENQLQAMSKCQIPVKIFHVKPCLTNPVTVEYHKRFY
jgi:hypothetical protein